MTQPLTYSAGPIDSPLINDDLAPTSAAQRTWSVWSIAALWVSMSACIPTYTLAAGMITGGMNWWQAVLTVFAGNVVVLVPMLLNAHAGAKYGIPFPVYCRASFGTLGANVPAMLRALVACGWFGIQTWIGGTAMLGLAAAFVPSLVDPKLHAPTLGITGPQFAAFMAFWLVNMAVIYAGIESIRVLLNVKAPLLIGLGLLLLGWAYVKSNGNMLNQPSTLGPGKFWPFFWPALTGVVGFWSTLSLNIPDFTRYAKSQRDQMVGQALGLPTTMALYSFIGVAVTSATFTIYHGKMIGDPVALVNAFTSKPAVVVAMISIVLATLATNIAANVVSPANDFANLAPRLIGFRTGGLMTGVIGVLMMPWLFYQDPHGYIFIWLIGTSSLLGAVGGVLVVDYWFLRRRQLDVAGLYDPAGPYRYAGGVNWRAMAAVALAILPCVPGFVAQVTGKQIPATQRLDGLYQYAWFVTFLIAAGVHAGLMLVVPPADA